MGISRARVSQIEHGQTNGLDLLRSHISAIGGEPHPTVSQGPLNVTLDLSRTAVAESTPLRTATTRPPEPCPGARVGGTPGVRQLNAAARRSSCRRSPQEGSSGGSWPTRQRSSRSASAGLRGSAGPCM